MLEKLNRKEGNKIETSHIYETVGKLFILLVRKIEPELRKLNLYPGQEIFLGIIAKEEGITPVQLADLTKRTKATITNSIKSLEKVGYVEKKNSKTDKRKQEIYLTEEGRKVNEKVKRIIEKIYLEIDTKLEIKEREFLENIVKKLCKQEE